MSTLMFTSWTITVNSGVNKCFHTIIGSYLFEDQIVTYEDGKLCVTNFLFTIKINNHTGYFSSYSPKYEIYIFDKVKKRSIYQSGDRYFDIEYQKLCDFILCAISLFSL